MAKNAGKTTVLNALIGESKTNLIAITSIGLDGEKIDNITNQEKPRIKVYPNMLIATAMDCLKESTIEFVIHQKTKINTPLGEIVIVEVTKEGLVLVAGPSTNYEMYKVLNTLSKYKPKNIFIDGALFRKSIANRSLSDGVILVTGASYNSNIDTVVDDTKSVVDQLSINAYKEHKIINERNNETVIFYNENNDESVKIYDNLMYNEQILLEHLSNYNNLYIEGAVTDRIYNILVKKRNDIKKLKIIVNDPTKILMTPENFRNLDKIGIKVEVLNQIEILFVAYNPTSPFGYNFQNIEFKQKLENVLKQKVINVCTDLE